MHNAAQQLQSVAQQVALQQGKAIAAPARLLPHKQLETMCVQVQPERMKENEQPLLPRAAIQPKAIMLNQPVGRSSSLSGLNIINPQIIRIQPVTGTGPQQFFLHNSSEPPVQLLVQRPLHPLGPVSVNNRKTVNGQRTPWATVSAANASSIAVVSHSSGNPVSSLEKNQKELKLKKSLKVKTRSGRISRPPKYKAKDYKLIKTEDLADGHKSDSDDYSELSVEEDDEGKAKEMAAPFDPLNYDLKPKLFKCQTCEKSYIGQGGLARHYKLNSGHGQIESLQQKVPVTKPHENVYMENAGGASDETLSLMISSPPTSVSLSNEKALVPSLEETASQNGQPIDQYAEDRPLIAQQYEMGLVHGEPGMPKGPERPRQPKRHGRPKMAGRSSCLRRLGRPGQSPSKSLNNMSTEHSVFRRKTRLKELILQCDDKDLMELVLPRLAKLVTVYEFLLMKVEKGCPAKAFFPDVYREFEELHNMVKKMSQDHFSNFDFLSCKEPVEIKIPKVIKGIISLSPPPPFCSLQLAIFIVPA
uniref:C2H2-type domain-containing protein n=1 Tax=Sphenodon punctatus TaxID=8508 RepID=A0A8D0GVN7_SPHPU